MAHEIPCTVNYKNNDEHIIEHGVLLDFLVVAERQVHGIVKDVRGDLHSCGLKGIKTYDRLNDALMAAGALRKEHGVKLKE